MKKLLNASTYKAFFTAMLLSFMQIIALAQDKVVTTTTRTERHWYVEPWVWIIGGITLIVLLALIFGGKNKTTITTTRTIE